MSTVCEESEADTKPFLQEMREGSAGQQAGTHLFREGRALYEYPCIRKSVYRFKYGGRKEYALFYGDEIARHLGKVILSWKPDALIPVPLHSSRKRKRGYNQAGALAAEVGKRLEIPVLSGLIVRVKNTTPLKLLTPAMRQNNLKRAFKICGNVVKLNTIIIIDDIYTTGSTVDAMAAVLQEAGIKHVYFIALAIGKG